MKVQFVEIVEHLPKLALANYKLCMDLLLQSLSELNS